MGRWRPARKAGWDGASTPVPPEYRLNAFRLRMAGQRDPAGGDLAERAISSDLHGAPRRRLRQGKVEDGPWEDEGN